MKIMGKNISLSTFNFNRLAFSHDKLFHGKMSEELSLQGLELNTVPLPKIQFCILNWFGLQSVCFLPLSPPSQPFYLICLLSFLLPHCKCE